MHHTQTYWDYKHLANFLFVHYADMRNDLVSSLRQIASFIDMELSAEEFEAIERAVAFERVKEQAVTESEALGDENQVFIGGQATFINKGEDLTSQIGLADATRQLRHRKRRQIDAGRMNDYRKQGGKKVVVILGKSSLECSRFHLTFRRRVVSGQHMGEIVIHRANGKSAFFSRKRDALRHAMVEKLSP